MRSLFILSLSLTASPVFAAADAQPDFGDVSDIVDEDDSDIVVIATRIRGQVDTDQPPIMTLDEADVASYGASSIGELIEAVSPQTSSGRGRGGGRPVILLNGQRISSFRVMRNLPPEAIRRMEVLPEEVSLRFGYPPDQRLINFILKDNYSSKTVAGEYNLPTRGGFDNWELEGGYLSIDGPRRFNVEAKIVEDSMLTEAERGVRQAESDIPTVEGDPDPARFRSLVDANRDITFAGNWSTGLGKDGLNGTLGLDGSYTRTDTRSLSGLDTVLLVAPDSSEELRSLGDALVRETGVDRFEAGASFNKPLGGWQLSATLDANYSDTRTRIDREADVSGLIQAAAAGSFDIAGPLPAVADPGFDRARTRLLTLASFASLAGQPFRLPAGQASLTVSTGYDHISNRNSDTRSGLGTAKLSRDILTASANLGLPLTSRKNGVAGSFGDISLNFSGALHDFSDFGTLSDWSAGLIWSPLDDLTLNASYIVSEVAPSVGQLGDPEIVRLNVPVYDFTLGEAALVNIITGGNPGLLAEQQRDIKLSANYDLPLFRRSSLLVEYFRNSSDDVTRSFPLLTPAVEAAFPGRVQRDASGRLVSIDRRPVTFDKVESSRLRWGINLSGRVAKEEEQRSGARRGADRGGPGFGRMGGRRNGGRWNISLYHTWRFTDRVTIAQGGPVLDQLDGDALTAGGVPRHSLELEGGIFHKGKGIRISADWDSSATVLASGAPGSSNLRFGGVFRLDARIFINFGMQEKLVEKVPFLRGFRLAFDFDNIFDSRQKVTDESGMVPLAYQADYRDPRGRFVGIDLRKMF